MARKDVLAAGQRAATFVGADVPGAEDNIYRNLSTEPRDESVPEIKKTIEPRKKFIPNPGVLLVRPIEVVVPHSAIIIEQDPNSKEKPSEGEVLACGDLIDDYSPQEVGSHIVYGKYSGTEFKLNGEILLLLDFRDVKGRLVLEDETPEVEIEIYSSKAGQ